MEKHRHVFERFATFDNLYDGYRKASKDRRYQGCVLRYTDHLEENLINSVNQLQWHEYHVGELHQFYEYYPKKRIISSLPFYDRVINCGAYNVLWPIYLKSMYEYSYGSIDGRGPLKAAYDIQQWMRNVARMNPRNTDGGGRDADSPPYAGPDRPHQTESVVGHCQMDRARS